MLLGNVFLQCQVNAKYRMGNRNVELAKNLPQKKHIKKALFIKEPWNFINFLTRTQR